MEPLSASVLPEDGTASPSIGEWLLRTGVSTVEDAARAAISDRFPGSNPPPSNARRAEEVSNPQGSTMWSWLTPALVAVVVAILLWRSLGVVWALAVAAAVGAAVYWII